MAYSLSPNVKSYMAALSRLSLKKPMAAPRRRIVDYRAARQFIDALRCNTWGRWHRIRNALEPYDVVITYAIGDPDIRIAAPDGETWLVPAA